MKRRDIFGPTRTWNDVRSVVTGRMRKKFPRTYGDDIEDAVSLAMVDLVDYWVQLPSSIDPENVEKTFWQACKRGSWMAATFLTKEWDDRPVPVGDFSEDYIHPNVSAPLWSAEDAVLAHDEAKSFHRTTRREAALAGDWLEPFLAGVTTREQARIEGVNQSAVARRWQNHMAVFATDVRSALGL